MILKLLRGLASSGPIYVKVKRNWLSVRDTSNGNEFQDTTEVAVKNIEAKASIVSIGSNAKYEAAKADVELKNGFGHPRVIIGDFSLAEKTLMYFLSKIYKNKIIRPSPVLIIHVLETLEGGMSQIEDRALRELGVSAGGREIYLWYGKELSDQEIQRKEYII